MMSKKIINNLNKGIMSMFKKKTPKEKIINYIGKNFSSELQQLLIPNVTEKIELDWEKKITPPTNKICTKWAGYPDLPENTPWPENTKRKLDFLVQFNLEEFEGYLDLLPKKGLISIFVDVENLYADSMQSREKVKIIYNEKTDSLVKNTTQLFSGQKEYALDVIKTYAILPSDSPKLGDLEMNDQEFDCWDNLTFSLIDEYVNGCGYISVGQHINDTVLDDWQKTTNNENTDDYFSIFEILLDTLGYPDNWLEIGFLKEDLIQLNFNNPLLSLYGT